MNLLVFCETDCIESVLVTPVQKLPELNLVQSNYLVQCWNVMYFFKTVKLIFTRENHPEFISGESSISRRKWKNSRKSSSVKNPGFPRGAPTPKGGANLSLGQTFLQIASKWWKFGPERDACPKFVCRSATGLNNISMPSRLVVDLHRQILDVRPSSAQFSNVVFRKS